MEISGGIVMSGNWNIPSASPAPAPATVTYKWFIGESPGSSGTSNTITVSSVTWGRINLGSYENPVWTGNNQIVFQRPMRSPAGNVYIVSRASGYLSGNVQYDYYKALSNAEVNVFVSAMTTGTTIDFYDPQGQGPTLFAETVTLTQNATLFSVLNNDYVIANVNSNFKDGVNDGPGETVWSNSDGNYYMLGFANINYKTNVLASLPVQDEQAPANVTYKWFMGESTGIAGTSNIIGISSVSWGRRNLGSNIFAANNQIVFDTYWFTSTTSRLNYYLTEASQHNPTPSQQNVIINAMTTGTTLDFYRYNPDVSFAETLTLTANVRRQVFGGTEYIVANVNANFRDGVNDGPGQALFDNTNSQYYMFGFANVYFKSNILLGYPA
jgi:hypothetical protein